MVNISKCDFSSYSAVNYIFYNIYWLLNIVLCIFISFLMFYRTNHSPWQQSISDDDSKCYLQLCSNITAVYINRAATSPHSSSEQQQRRPSRIWFYSETSETSSTQTQRAQFDTVCLNFTMHCGHTTVVFTHTITQCRRQEASTHTQTGGTGFTMTSNKPGDSARVRHKQPQVAFKSSVRSSGTGPGSSVCCYQQTTDQLEV